MKFQIKDFVDMQTIEFEHLHHVGDYVMITQSAGSMYFQHTMRPEQARFLASALLIAAEEAEQSAAKAKALEAQP